MKQFNYKNLTKEDKRKEMSDENVSCLGTKSGGFGPFTTHFKVVSGKGRNEITAEVKRYCDNVGVDFNALIDALPTLKDVIK